MPPTSRSTWSRPAALAALATLATFSPGRAHAGACCAPAAAPVPTRVPRSELALAGLAFVPSGAVGRVSSAGAVGGSSLRAVALTTTAFGAIRWDARGQIAVTVPVVVRHRAAGDLASWGAGPGDVSVLATWESTVETVPSPGQRSAPVVVLTGGLRAPTGRGPGDARDPLEADVTGEGHAGLVSRIQVERLLASTPWWVALGTDLGVGPEGVRPSVEASVGVGHAWGDVGSLVGSLTHRSRFKQGLDGAWARTATTTAGLQGGLVVAPRVRLWLGLTGDLPLPGLTADSLVELGGTLGLTVGVPPG